jgi:hypothetical protein
VNERVLVINQNVTFSFPVNDTNAKSVRQFKSNDEQSTPVTDDPPFEIPARPERRFSRTTVRYDGNVEFTLTPAEGDTNQIEKLVSEVLDTGPYRYGDWSDLPMALFLVHDDATHDTFRVSVRDGTVTLHVLPETGSAGLRALYDRLVRASNCTWSVDRRVEVA